MSDGEDRSAIDVVRDMIDEAANVGATLTYLRVSPSMYKALEEECGPIPPSDYFDLLIEADPKLATH
jgi:hypothetical protein